MSLPIAENWPGSASSLLAFQDDDLDAHPSWAAGLGAAARSMRTRPSSNLGARCLVSAGGCRQTSRCVVRPVSATSPRRSLRFRVGRVAQQARNRRPRCVQCAETVLIQNLLVRVSLTASSISVASTRRYLASPPSAFSTPKSSQLSTRATVF